MSRPLFHIVEAGGWPASGAYRPASLASQGFVHLSYAEQVEDSANRFYAVAEALDVVEIDPSSVADSLVIEDSYGTGVSFPHAYAPVPAAAAVAVRRMRREDGRWVFPVVRVSAVVLRDPTGRVLGVRKRGTRAFMFPGGKPEPGESALAAAVRELREELLLEVRAEQLRGVGTFAADAANEDGHLVEGVVFEASGVDVGTIRLSAEIEELRWEPIDVDAYPDDVALLSGRVFRMLSAAAPPSFFGSSS